MMSKRNLAHFNSHGGMCAQTNANPPNQTSKTKIKCSKPVCQLNTFKNMLFFVAPILCPHRELMGAFSRNPRMHE
jgi:hypothetical protein